MQQRTEEEMIAMAPIKVTFGKESYDIHPLTILPSQKWRQQLIESAHDAPMQISPEDVNKPAVIAEAIKSSLTNYLFKSPEKIAKLIFLYAPNLPESEIMETASIEQFRVAFAGIMQMACPFFDQLGSLMELAKVLNQQR